jgi:hypothetical protein
LARETLKSFLTQKGSTQDSISYIRKESPDGLGVDPGTGEELLDLANDAKGLLGDYLKYVVDNSNNEYKIKPGNEKASSSNKGDDLVIADLQGAEKVFVEQGTTLKSELNKFSNSNQFNTSGTNLDTLIDKVGKNFTNHEKLKEIKGKPLDKYGNILANKSGDSNDIVQATQRLFKKNNRFANVGDNKQQSFVNENKSVLEFENPSTDSNSGTLKIENKFGEYNKDENIVERESLKKLGASLILNASGFSDIERDSVFPDPNEGYKKIDNSKTRARDNENFPKDASGESIRNGKGDNLNNDPNATNSKSFGQTYNSEYMFLGKNARKHRIEAIIYLITLKKICNKFFNSFISSLTEIDRDSLKNDAIKYVSDNKDADIRVYMLGKSSTTATNKINNYISNNIITNTTYPYGNCIERGLETIFGGDLPKTKEEIKSSVPKKSSLGENPGFWLAVAKSVLKTFESITAKYSDGSIEELNTNQMTLLYKDLIQSNKFISFFNVMAIIGDASFRSTDGKKTKIQKAGIKTESINHRNVDNLPDTRTIPGKHRKFSSTDNTNKAQNFADSDAPSMYLLPGNIIKAASLLNNTVYGESPVRGMFGSKLIKNTYTGIDTFGSYNRIPGDVVKILEDKLEAEYVPFYIQDLRTNEIIAFNAFLTDLTDNIQSKFAATSGYGRLDPVQTYDSTTRTIKVGFHMLATNKEDFDAMWYKINKLTTLLYPQWTPGTIVSNGTNSTMYQPFSQVIGGSPIIRLRVGDIIKSNYSRFALARTFGIGDRGIDPKVESGNPIKDQMDIKSKTFTWNDWVDVAVGVWLLAFGSPQSVISAVATKVPGFKGGDKNAGKVFKRMGVSAAANFLSNFLVNGFANPLAVDSIIQQLRDPNLDPNNYDGSFPQSPGGAINRVSDRIQNSTSRNLNLGDNIASGYNTGKFFKGKGLSQLRQLYLKANNNTGYVGSSGKRYYFMNKVKVTIIEKFKDNTGKVFYKAIPVEGKFRINNEEEFIKVTHDDIVPDAKELFTNTIMGASLFLSDPGGLIDSVFDAASDWSLSRGIPNDVSESLRYLYATENSNFMQGELNPFVKAFESSRGRGLAGVINGGINFNWLNEDTPWETDWGSRAPMGCKLSFNFAVIHDIPPGLDHTGYNRAPIYNVGSIMNNIAGDVYTDDGRQGEFNFRRESDKLTNK